jgi:hypothetical protein
MMTNVHVVCPNVPAVVSAVACACLIAFALFHAVVALGRSAMPAINLASAQILAQSVYEVTFETVSKGSRSGVRDPRQVVLRSQGEWNALWAQHVSADAKPVPPPLDFARELVGRGFSRRKAHRRL